MWILIGLIVAGVLIKFFIDWGNQKEKIAQQGGMEKKYRVLIAELLTLHPKNDVIHRGTDTLTVGMSSPQYSFGFYLIQGFSTLMVNFKLKLSNGKEDTINWEFQEYGDQHKMVEKIKRDCSKYFEFLLGIESHKKEPDNIKLESYKTDVNRMFNIALGGAKILDANGKAINLNSSLNLAGFIEVNIYGLCYLLGTYLERYPERLDAVMNEAFKRIVKHFKDLKVFDNTSLSSGFISSRFKMYFTEIDKIHGILSSSHEQNYTLLHYDCSTLYSVFYISPMKEYINISNDKESINKSSYVILKLIHHLDDEMVKISHSIT